MAEVCRVEFHHCPRCANLGVFNSLFQPWKKRRQSIHTVQESLSTKRIAAQFGEEDRTIMYQSKKSASHVQQGLEDNDRAVNSDWVSKGGLCTHSGVPR